MEKPDAAGIYATPVMKKLDWYILKRFLSSFFFVMFILIAIVSVIDLTEKNDEFIEHNLGFFEIAGYFINFIPYIANFIMPIIVFIAAVFTTSKMAQHTEIIAILSSGVSFRRMLVPFMVGAIIIGAGSFILNAYLLPNANKERRDFELAYIKNPYRNLDRNIHIKVGPTSYAYLESYNNTDDTGYKFTLETIDNNQLMAKLSARRIAWDTASNSWHLTDWEKRILEGRKEVYSTGQQLDTLINLAPSDFGTTYHLQETFTLPELNDYIDLLRSRGADNIVMYEIEKYFRFMAPFAALILTFIGVIMSARKSRGGSGLMIAMGFGLAFVYIILYVFTKSIAEAGSMPPLIAVWIPNLLFSLIGLLLYRNIPR